VVTVTKTTISIDEETRDRLAALGGKDDTFDVIVRRLLDRAEKNGN